MDQVPRSGQNAQDSARSASDPAPARWKVVRTGIPLGGIEEGIALLASLGASFEQRACTGEDETIAATRDADVIISSATYYTPRVIAALERCRAIIQQSVGYDFISIEAATAREIVVGNLHDYCVEEVADHAMALILACGRRLPAMQRFTRGGDWRGTRGYRLTIIGPVERFSKTTLGIVGFGNIGRLVARRAAGFGWRMLASDPVVGPDVAAAHGATLVPLEELLRAADFVTLHVPLNDRTRGLIGRRQIELMKPGAYLVNTCRGPVVDEPALVEALREGRIAGAGLDVFETEPIPTDHPLLAMENVIATPHAAVYSVSALEEWRSKSFQEAARVLRGHWPRGLINRELRGRLPYTDEP